MFEAYKDTIREIFMHSKKPMSTTELKEYLNNETHYGTSSSELKSFLKKHPSDFHRVGSTRVVRESGCYKVDLWFLNALTASGAVARPADVPSPIAPAPVSAPLPLPPPPPVEPPSVAVAQPAEGRLRWTKEMKMTFIKLRVVEKMSQGDIAVKMGIRLCQVKGMQKELKSGKLDDIMKEMGIPLDAKNDV